MDASNGLSFDGYDPSKWFPSSQIMPISFKRWISTYTVWKSFGGFLIYQRPSGIGKHATITRAYTRVRTLEMFWYD